MTAYVHRPATARHEPLAHRERPRSSALREIVRVRLPAMRPSTLLGIGACGGALAALLYHTAYPTRSFPPSVFAPADPASTSVRRDSIPRSVGDLPAGLPVAANDVARARRR